MTQIEYFNYFKLWAKGYISIFNEKELVIAPY